ncbi:MAG TPA: PEP-CTERM sorting domain-containing protein [Candidatus Acidoferrales bacterium]|jgi:subtilisin-like proprotein convertase family protein|nr:PEP-CTERM sorting domain-containing protein [Candidatus Acidoferrales bacterium]
MALLFAGLAGAQTNYTYSSGTLNTAIPDGNPVGISSSTTFSSLPGIITSIQVNLDITGGFNGDLYAYLAGPTGQFAVLLNRVGVTGVGAGNAFGYSDAGFNVTFDQSGANIHNYQTSVNPGGGQLTGTWAPDGRNIDPASAPSLFDSASTSADLGQFVNIDPNGTWTLFLADMSGGGQSTLNSWGLTIVTVPEPQTWAMLAGGAGMLLMFRRRGSR